MVLPNQTVLEFVRFRPETLCVTNRTQVGKKESDRMRLKFLDNSTATGLKLATDF